MTGGAGYVGSHACKALIRHGLKPVVIDNFANGHEPAVRWGPLEHTDISDRRRLGEVIERYKPTAVVHFAAFTYVGESVADPGKYYRNNVAGTLTLLEAMRDHGVHKLVFSSTAAVYGIPDSVPIPESAPQRPINPYGTSKLMVEMMLKYFDTAHGIRSIALRYFNAASADPDGEIGELHDPESHLILFALDAIAGRGPPLTVFGDDYDTPDGTCIRDYIHVSDLTDAHVLALKALERGEARDAYNLGTGKGASVREVLAAIERATGVAVPQSVGPRRPGDPAVLVSEAQRSASQLDWQPRLSDLNTIVATACAWHRKAHG